MDYSISRKFQAMMRAYEKLKKVSIADEPKMHINVQFGESADLAEAFFSQCYHLKDYIIKELPQVGRQTVERYISSNGALRIAADYCNSLKHAGLDKPPRSGDHIKSQNAHHRIDLMPKGLTALERLEIVVGPKSYDAFKLATDCVSAWKAFLVTHGITIPPP